MTQTWSAVASAVPYLLLLLGLAATVLTDRYMNRLHKTIMLVIVALTATLIAQNVADYLLFYERPSVMLRTIVGIYGYAVRPAIIVLYFYFFIKGDIGKKMIPAWCLVALNAALYMTALFSPLTFSYDRETISFHRGPLGFTCHVVGALLLFGLFLLVLYVYRARKREIIFPIICILFITGGVLADAFLSFDVFSAVSALTISVVISCVFVYFWFHVQFVQRHESDLMAQQRIKIMVSQIQPHFLYNTIATFRALCKREPDKAAEVAEKFGLYLRQNLESLNREDLIPVEKELEHTRLYADIEMVRFENLRVEYDVQDTDFCLPALTVQPMVENAIRHGVRARKEGIVRVSTRPADGWHEIVIQDNGIGFDPSQAPQGEGTHIGIENVRERIEKLCEGSVTIESEKGNGTTVTIRVP